MKKKINVCHDFFKLIEKYTLAYVYSITDIEQLHLAVNDFKWPEDIFIDIEALKKRMSNPYHIAVKHLILLLSEQKQKLGPIKNLKIIFDEKTEASAVFAAYKYLKYSSDEATQKLLANIDYASDENTLPLQAADLYAGLLRSAHMSGIDLSVKHPFPWSPVIPKPTLYMYQKYDFFMREFEGICSDKNVDTFLKYIKEDQSK